MPLTRRHFLISCLAASTLLISQGAHAMTTQFGVAPGSSNLLLPVRRVYNLADALTAQKAGHQTITSLTHVLQGHTWAQTTAGASNTILDTVRAQLELLPLGAGWICPWHEPENDAKFGTPADFCGMFNYVRTYLGHPNGARYVNILMGWTFDQGQAVYSKWLPPTFGALGSDAYNWAAYHGNSWRSFAQTVAGSETAAAALSKPLIVAEFGSHPTVSSTENREQWCVDAVAHARSAGHLLDSYFDENDSSNGANWQLSATEAAAYVKAAAA